MNYPNLRTPAARGEHLPLAREMGYQFWIGLIDFDSKVAPFAFLAKGTDEKTADRFHDQLVLQLSSHPLFKFSNLRASSCDDLQTATRLQPVQGPPPTFNQASHREITERLMEKTKSDLPSCTPFLDSASHAAAAGFEWAVVDCDPEPKIFALCYEPSVAELIPLMLSAHAKIPPFSGRFVSISLTSSFPLAGPTND